MENTGEVSKSVCGRVWRWVPDQVSKRLGAVGRFAACRPWLLICAGLVLMASGVPGWVKYKVAPDPEELWIPPNSVEAHRQESVREMFGKDELFYQVRILGWISLLDLAGDSEWGSKWLEGLPGPLICSALKWN